MEFEVFGRVQNVCFRQYTYEKAKTLGLVGWVRNVNQTRTVKGVVEGPAEHVDQMRVWLSKEGSPKSHIDGLNQTTTPIQTLTFKQFTIQPTE